MVSVNVAIVHRPQSVVVYTCIAITHRHACSVSVPEEPPPAVRANVKELPTHKQVPDTLRLCPD